MCSISLQEGTIIQLSCWQDAANIKRPICFCCHAILLSPSGAAALSQMNIKHILDSEYTESRERRMIEEHCNIRLGLVWFCRPCWIGRTLPSHSCSLQIWCLRISWQSTKPSWTEIEMLTELGVASPGFVKISSSCILDCQAEVESPVRHFWCHVS